MQALERNFQLLFSIVSGSDGHGDSSTVGGGSSSIMLLNPLHIISDMNDQLSRLLLSSSSSHEHGVIHDEQPMNEYSGSCSHLLFNDQSGIFQIVDYLLRNRHNQYTLASASSLSSMMGDSGSSSNRSGAVVNATTNSSVSDHSKTSINVRKGILDLVSNYMKQVGRRGLLDYAHHISYWCFQIFRRDDSNMVRVASIDPLIQLMEHGLLASSSSAGTTTNDQPSPLVSDHDNKQGARRGAGGDGIEPESGSNNSNPSQMAPPLGQMFDVFMKVALKKAGSGSSTLRSQVFILLGKMAQYHPSEVSVNNRHKLLFQLYMDTLKQQSTEASPDSQLIVGSFKGIECYLHQFEATTFTTTTTTSNSNMGNSSSTASQTNHMTLLYSYMITALERIDASRHDLPKAALSLLGTHSYPFREYLTIDAEKMYDRMKLLCNHRNDKVRKHAFRALDAFLSHVAHELVASSNVTSDGGQRIRSVELNQRTFLILLDQFKQMLDQKKSNPQWNNKNILSMAIRSFGQFAEPMHRFLGQSDTKLILLKLLKLSDQMLTRSQEELEESISHLPSFLSVFANLILQLDTVDGWILDHLERIFGVLYLVYPKQFLFPKYRYANYLSVMKLFIALYLKQNSLDLLLSRIVFQGLTLTISNSSAVNSDGSTGTNNNLLVGGDENGGETESLNGSNDESMMASVPLHVQYLDLWSNMLNGKNIQLVKWNYPWVQLNFSTDLQDHMFSVIYDRILNAIVDMINKLDVRCKVVVVGSSGKEEEIGGNATEISPTNAKDYELHLNLVEFCRKFMRKCQPRHCIRWIFILCKVLIDKIQKHPHVSGFFKILTVLMKICEQYNYFDGVTEKSSAYDAIIPASSHNNNAPNTTTNPLQEKLFVPDDKTRISCFHLLHKFCKTTIMGLHDRKGDLLAASLCFILSMPKQFVDRELFVTPLSIAFEMGRSYLPLASVGLSALEYYMKVLESDVLTFLLPKILPLLAQYLTVRSSVDNEEGSTRDLSQRKLNNSSSHRNSIRKTQQNIEDEKRKTKETSKLFKDIDNISLRSIQLRVIRLLGKLGGNNALVLNDEKEETRRAIAWDTKERVQFNLPFRDVKPEIFYDPILPRVAELAESSSDRQTKIAAGEFLHSIVLYMIGKNAYSPQARQRAQQRIQESMQRNEPSGSVGDMKSGEVLSEPTPFYQIYSHIFPLLLKLAVDMEVVTRQLFEPLVYQLTHWLTQNMHYENRETMALLDCIVEGVSNAKDGALRDLCANLLNEFLRWSIKHDKSNKYVNVKSLFQRLYSQLHHPNSDRRLGAILAFNRMYRSFREVEVIVDRHVLELLYNVLTSLRMASHNTNEDEAMAGNESANTGSNVIERTHELIEHLQKIVMYKSKLLSAPKSDRAGTITCLRDMVDWVFTNCSCSQAPLRKQCMRLFPVLCMQLENFETEDGPKRWVYMMTKQKSIEFIVGHIHREISQLESVMDDEKASNVSHIVFWMGTLEAYMDYLLWLFNSQILYPHSIFNTTTATANAMDHSRNEHVAKRMKLSDGNAAPAVEASSTTTTTEHNVHPLFHHMFKFINQFAWKSPQKIKSSITSKEEEQMNTKKCVTLLKVIDFLVLMTEKFSETLLKQELKILNTRFFGLILLSLLDPERVGFSTTQESVQVTMPRQIKKLLHAVLHDKRLKDNGYSSTLVALVKKLLNSDGKLNLIRFSLSDMNLNLDDATFLFRGYRLLHMLNILEGNIAMSTPQLSVKLGTMIFNYEQPLSPVQLQIARELWELCFEFGFPPRLLVQFLLDDTPHGRNDLLSQQLSQIDSQVDPSDGGAAVSHSTSTTSTTTLPKKGSVFYKNFRREITSYMLKRVNTFVGEMAGKASEHPMVVDILLNIGQQLARDSNMDAQPFVTSVAGQLTPLIEAALVPKGNVFESGVNICKLVERMMKLDTADVTCNPQVLSLSYKLIEHALKSKKDQHNPTIDLKIQAIRTVPIMMQKLNSDEQKRTGILYMIRHIVINDFPLSHTELVPNSVAYEEHVALLDELLAAMCDSHSVPFLEQILPIFRWKDHPMKPKISSYLRRFLSGLSSSDQVLECMNMCQRTLFNETLPIDIRQSIIQWVCLLCAQTTHSSILTKFFEQNIKKLTQSIMSTVTYDPTVMNQDDVRALYVTKTCCFNLIEAMYRLLPAITVKDTINKVFCDNKDNLSGKELTEKVMRAAYAARSFCPPEQETRAIGYALLLEYHTSAYNTLAGAVKCTQTQEKFYTGFLFKEKNNDLWGNIVDTQKKYDFQIETNFSLYKKAVQELRLDTTKSSAGESRGNFRLKYLSSQYLSDSSLSSEIPYIGSFFVPGSKYASTHIVTEHNNNSTDKNTKEEVPLDIESEEALELDEINSNPCMPTILRIIEYVTQTFKPDKKVVPSWMQEMVNTLDNEETHPNIKLFIAKIIINRPSVFEPYALKLFAPLVRLVISPDNGGTGIHYFVRDIVVLLLKWKDMMPSDTTEDRNLASSLVAYLMKHCAHQKRMILRSNLELIKLIVEKWRNRISIQKSIILRWICYDQKNASSAKLARTTGLQLLGVILANDMPAYDHELDITILPEQKFYEKIVDNLQFHNKDVYEAAAEVAGMILYQLHNNNQSEERVDNSIQLFEQILLGTLNQFLSAKQYDRLLNCLHKIGIHFTSFLDNFLPRKILDIMPHLYGVFKKIALQIICWRAEHIEDLYVSLKPYIPQFLHHQEETTQLLTLQIILKLVRNLRNEDIIHFVRIVKENLHENEQVFHSTFSEESRTLYYSILIWLFDNKEGFRNEDIVRTELLKGLHDRSEVIRRKILEFWDQESRLSVQSVHRMEQLFTMLYSEKSGEKWLNNSTFLLLQLAHRSPDFNDCKAIFSESLSDCEFKEYRIDLSWQSRSLPMTPLFSSMNQSRDATTNLSYYASLQSIGSSYNPDVAIKMEENDDQQQQQQQQQQKLPTNRSGLFKATQTAQFSLTQFGASIRETLSDPTLTQTSLLFTPFKKVTTQSSNNSDSMQQPGNVSHMRLRRRFASLKDSQSTLNQAKRAMRMKREREAWEAKQKVQRRNKIELYRTYRTGELPDIQIATRELILPLQALCLVDMKIAKDTFISLYSALHPSISSGEDKSLFDNIMKQFKVMMSQSRDCPLLMSSLLSLCLKHPDIIDSAHHSVSPKLIRQVSLQSHNVELGSLVLEKFIETKFLKDDMNRNEDVMSDDEEDEERSKTNAIVAKHRTDCWIELGKLYKAIRDDDVVRSIFEHNVSNQSVTHRGLNHESKGEYSEAVKLYTEATKSFMSSQWNNYSAEPKPYKKEVEFWKERQFECLRKLALWDKISERISKEVRGHDSTNSMTHIWNMKNVDTLLPLYIESQLKNNSVDTREFQQFLVESLQNETWRDILESRFSAELASFYILIGHNEKAKSHAIDAYGQFVVNWSSLSSLSKSERHAQLQKLQRVVEIEEYVNFLHVAPSSKVSGLLKLLNAWKHRYPSMVLDDFHVWDDVVCNRGRLLDNLARQSSSIATQTVENIDFASTINDSLVIHPSSSSSSSSLSSSLEMVDSLNITEVNLSRSLDASTIGEMIEEAKSHTFIKAAMAVRKQLYVTAAQKYLRQSKMSNNKKDEPNFDFFSSLVKLMNVKRSNFDSTLQFIENQRDKYCSNHSPVNMRIKFQCLMAKTCSQYAEVLELKKGKSEKYGTPSQLYHTAMSILQETVQLSRQHSLTLGAQATGKVYMTYGTLCDTLLRSSDCSDITQHTTVTKEQLAQSLVNALLSAMQCDSRQAQAKFPRLLELLEKYSSARREFAKFINGERLSIPSHMFLPWISQILSHMNGTESSHLLPILDSIAELYPNALYFPLSISRSDITNSDKSIQLRVSSVEQKLRNPVLSQLISSLRDMDHPELRFKSWIDRVKSVYKTYGQSKSQLQMELKKIWSQVFEDLFDVDKPYMGSYNKRFARNWVSSIKAEFGGRDAAKICHLDQRTFEEKAAKLHMGMVKTKGALQPGKAKLNYFSAYLADFDANSDPAFSAVEIPGQYKSIERPNVDKHVKIVSFDPSILIMGSIRKPKRIKIHGSDEQEYMFLVKGGEDLRQDQRIQQLFEVMNNVLRNDPETCKRHLYLKTYSVIPMTKDVGILEWVSNTRPLKALIEEELSRATNTPNAEILKHPTTMMHMQMLRSMMPKNVPQLNQVQQYFALFQRGKREEVEALITEQYRLIPPDLLKNGVMALASSAEAFFTLRNRYARSLAVFNTCSYILGIGDRHLENFLLDCSDGQILGIDFGHAFGSATEILPIPELMPFRLTRQLLHVMHPLSASNNLTNYQREGMVLGGGLYRESMKHTLSALHSHQDILLNTMDVFIKEPLVDWLKFASRNKQQPQQEQDQPTSSSSHNQAAHSWYPERKIRLAKQKLNLMNPVHITLDDLTTNLHVKPVAKYVNAVVVGNESINVRAQIEGEQCASIEQQVDCLIDMATDPNILGRTYIGWCAHF